MERNNKTLYEQIMKNVSKHVKRALLEYDEPDEFVESDNPFIDIYNDGKYYPKDNGTLSRLVRYLMLEEDTTDLNCIDVSAITDFSFVFADNSGLPWIDIDEWDVSHGTNFSYMFQDCEYFNADLSKWDVRRGENFEGMFYNCTSFDSDLRNWNPYSAVNMNKMFFNCKELDCDFRNWRPRFLKEANDVFYGCDNLRIKNPNWLELYRFKTKQW